MSHSQSWSTAKYEGIDRFREVRGKDVGREQKAQQDCKRKKNNVK